MQRRNFLKLLLASASAGVLPGCGGFSHKRGSARRGRVVVLAFDGMDPKVLRGLIAAGRTPNFARLAQRGSFKSITTSDPPQTPVAFSNIISGATANQHQVYDFIHRDPNPKGPIAVRPYFSTSDVKLPESDMGISMGKWRIALSGGEPQLLRRGGSYWQPLIKEGVNASVFFLPSNYPPQDANGPGELECASGMGTPDLLGGYGTFTLFTPDAPIRGRRVSGGRFVYANLWGSSHRAELELEGPDNFLLNPKLKENRRAPKMKAKFVVVRDPERDLVKIELADQVLVLKAGEWSGWVPLDFETGIPGATVLGAMQAPTSLPGMVRFYVKRVHPKCELYVSPINLDPLRPANEISLPADLSPQLAREHGRFYTQGIPEDHNALKHDALDEDEFLAQSYLAHDERVEQYRRRLETFDAGCLFYYFGTTDLVSHMFWRDRDPDHPGRNPEQGDRYANVIDDLYVHMDDLVGETLDKLNEEDTLIVLSDHGFTSFRWSVNLNKLLLDHGLLSLLPGVVPGPDAQLPDIDWKRTKAYAVGLNSMFVNLHGREKKGIVAPGKEQRAVVNQVIGLLTSLRDPEHDNAAPIKAAYDVTKLFPQADPNIAPDVLVGYEHNYRVSWATPLCGVPETVLEPNLERWSGDHCVASQLVPGILLSSRPFDVEDPALIDIGPTLLSLFDVEAPQEMLGQSIFRNT